MASKAKKAKPKKKSTKKKLARKSVIEQAWTDNALWTVQYGELKRPKGRPPKIGPLFKVVGEKIPFDALDKVETHLKGKGHATNGVYVAHDSMGNARYVGRGQIFNRLKARWKAHQLELKYFSFYVVADKPHEREIETLLIRAAGPQLHFNDRKKRVDIAPGDIKDYEAGTLFYERQKKKGRKKAKKKSGGKTKKS